MKWLQCVVLFAVAAGLVFVTGCGGDKAAEPATGQEAAAPAEQPVPAAEASAAEVAEEPSGPLGDWPEAFIDDLKAAEAIRIYDRLPDNAIKALIKTPKDLKAKGLELEAEQENIPNRVALITLMNGWVTPDKWKESRKMAAASLQSLALLREKGEASVAEVVKILKPADISEADLRRVYENESALAKAVRAPK